MMITELLIEIGVRFILIMGCINLAITIYPFVDRNVFVVCLPGLAVSVYYALMYDGEEKE